MATSTFSPTGWPEFQPPLVEEMSFWPPSLFMNVSAMPAYSAFSTEELRAMALGFPLHDHNPMPPIAISPKNPSAPGITFGSPASPTPSTSPPAQVTPKGLVSSNLAGRNFSQDVTPRPPIAAINTPPSIGLVNRFQSTSFPPYEPTHEPSQYLPSYFVSVSAMPAYRDFSFEELRVMGLPPAQSPLGFGMPNTSPHATPSQADPQHAPAIAGFAAGATSQPQSPQGFLQPSNVPVRGWKEMPDGSWVEEGTIPQSITAQREFSHLSFEELRFMTQNGGPLGTFHSIPKLPNSLNTNSLPDVVNPFTHDLGRGQDLVVNPFFQRA